MKYKAILFDLDGTLVDDYPNYFKLMKLTANQLHLLMDDKLLKLTFSMPVNRALDCLDIPKAEQPAFESKYFINRASLKFKPVLFPGIDKLLKRLGRPLFPAIGIVTSGGKSEVDSLKANYLFTRQLWTIVTAESTLNHKPAPDPLLKALDQMGMQSNEALYIGDALSDEQAANGAKMDFGIAGWSANPKIHFKTAKYCFYEPQNILQLI